MQKYALAIVILCTACDSGSVGNGDGGPTGDDTQHPDAPGGVGEPPELLGITLAHNNARAAVQTATPLPAMQWNQALADSAKAYAMSCVDTDGNGLLDHNPNRSNGFPDYVGENIYASSGTASGDDAVQLWAAEGAHYHYDTNACDGGQVCGHYTQLVWRGTTKVGCALVSCPGLQYPSTILCDYEPGGNIGGEKPY
jgi:pathogenesis-related protein 1